MRLASTPMLLCGREESTRRQTCWFDCFAGNQREILSSRPYSSSSRRSFAAATVCLQVIAGTGSRSQTSRLGRSMSSDAEFHVCISTTPICASATTALTSLPEDTHRPSSFPGCLFVARLWVPMPSRVSGTCTVQRCRRAMNECEWAVDNVRQNPIADGLVIAREVELRKGQVRIDHAVGMRDANTHDGRTDRDSRGATVFRLAALKSAELSIC
jgi:hypothetical protein